MCKKYVKRRKHFPDRFRPAQWWRHNANRNGDYWEKRSIGLCNQSTTVVYLCVNKDVYSCTSIAWHSYYRNQLFKWDCYTSLGRLQLHSWCFWEARGKREWERSAWTHGRAVTIKQSAITEKADESPNNTTILAQRTHNTIHAYFIPSIRALELSLLQ